MKRGDLMRQAEHLVEKHREARSSLMKARWEHEGTRVAAEHALSLIDPADRARVLRESGFAPDEKFQTASALLRDIEGDAT